MNKVLGWVAATAAITAAATTALMPAAQATVHRSAHAATPSVHTSGKAVKLGSASAVSVIAEAPNGNVYFAIGKKVYVVKGTSKPALRVSVSKPVIALAATKTELFVQTGLTVFGYTPGHVKQWKLSSPVTPITSAGLLAVGSTVWSWTDWATDSSGFEFATVSEFTTSATKVKVISKSNSFPADMAADSAGLYYEARISAAKMDLVLTAPSGVTKHRVKANVDSPVALSAGRAVLLSVHTSSAHLFADSFNASNLASLGSKPVTDNARDIAGTSAGLLLLQCATVSCSKASVGVLNPATGKVSGSVSVPHAFGLLPGPAAALTDVAGNVYLVRLVK